MALDKLLFIVQKNLRLVFRNWTSFLLLVLGPLLLILIVGFAFSGDELHDISIGVHAPYGADISPVVDALASDEVTIAHFPTLDLCLVAMNFSIVNMCADFTDDFGDRQGAVTFYYDNTRYNLVRYILDYLKEQIAITSEQISLEATEQIFEDLGGFVAEMEQADVQVAELRFNALLLRQDMVELQFEVQRARQEFVPLYAEVKALQAELRAHVEEVSTTYGETANVTEVILDLVSLQLVIQDMRTSLRAIENSILVLSATHGFTFSSKSFAELYSSLDEADAQLTSTITYLQSTGDLTSVTLEESNEMLLHVDSLVWYLDEVDRSLAEIDASLLEHTANIDEGVTDLDDLSVALQEYITEFSAITQEDAETFLHPISATFQPLPSDEAVSKIELVFPLLLIFIICFISTLLSNMLVLNETHSPAYFRNFLVPVHNYLFILGLFITTLIIIGLQLLVFLLIAHFSFDVYLFYNFPVLLLSLLSATVVFVLFGMIFAYIIPQRQSSLLVSLFFALILFFFSDMIFPLEIMPPLAAFFAQFNPVVVGEHLFRRVLFYGHGVLQQEFGFVVLWIYTVFLGTAGVLAYYYNRSRR